MQVGEYLRSSEIRVLVGYCHCRRASGRHSPEEAKVWIFLHVAKICQDEFELKKASCKSNGQAVERIEAVAKTWLCVLMVSGQNMRMTIMTAAAEHRQQQQRIAKLTD